jgi:hypothetical protein
MALCVSVLLLLPGSQAQKAAWKFTGMADAGIVWGSYEPSGDIRLRGGLQRGAWSLTAGSGLDYYRFRSVPVFAGGQYFLGSSRSKPFVYAHGGVNLPALQEDEKGYSISTPPMVWIAPWMMVPNTYKAGYYADLGAGYAWLGKKGHGVNVSFGYTAKSTVEEVLASAYGGPGISTTYTEKFTYNMNRFALRVGYKW